MVWEQGCGYYAGTVSCILGTCKFMELVEEMSEELLGLNFGLSIDGFQKFQWQ